MGKKLGQGSYAVVHEAKDKRDGAVYAIKIISKEKSKEKRLKSEVGTVGEILNAILLF